MKLHTRLIDSGVFIFWNPDGDDCTANLKIYIQVGGNKIPLVDIYPPAGQNHFSFDRIGSGDYEIELNAYRNGQLYQTEIKNLSIASTYLRNEENTQAILERMGTIQQTLDNLANWMSDLYFAIQAAAATTNAIDNGIDGLRRQLKHVENELSDPQTICETRERVADYERRFY